MIALGAGRVVRGHGIDVRRHAIVVENVVLGLLQRHLAADLKGPAHARLIPLENERWLGVFVGVEPDLLLALARHVHLVRLTQVEIREPQFP